MVKYCTAKSCKNTSSKIPKLSFFRFPLDEERCKEWVVVSGRVDLLSKSAPFLHRNHHLCAQHFEDIHYYNGLKTRLKWQAVPTIFGSDENAQPAVSESIIDGGHSKTKGISIVEDMEPGEMASVPSIENVKVETNNIPSVRGVTLEKNKAVISSDVGVTLEKMTSVSGVDVGVVGNTASVMSVNGMTLQESASVSSFKPRKKMVVTSVGRTTQAHTKIVPRVESVASIQQELTTKLYDFCKTSQFCDTIIVAENNQQFWAHSAVLAASSDVLHSRLSSAMSSMKPELRFFIPLLNCNPDAVECVLQFIYTGRLVVPRSFNNAQHLSKILVACQALGIPLSRIDKLQLSFRENDADTHHMTSESREPSKSCQPVQRRQATEAIHVNEAINVPVATARRSASVKTMKNTVVVLEPVVTATSNLLISKLPVVRSPATDAAGVDGTQVAGTATVINIKREIDSNSSDNSLVNTGSTSNGDAPSRLIYSQLLLSMLEEAKRGPVREKRVKGVVKPKRYKCQKCNERFETSTSRRQHVREAHKLTCSTCGRRMLSEACLAKHEASHRVTTKSRPRSYCCSTCNSQYRFHCSLVHHQIKVHGDGSKSHLCEICGAAFLMSWSLRSHLRVHTRPFSCEKCGKAFATKSQVNEHILSCLTESSSKPFICDVCGTGFKFKGNLNRHAQSHMLGQLVCSECGQSFKHKQNLDFHVRRHHGGGSSRDDASRAVCTVCGESFLYKSLLFRHMAKHGLAPKRRQYRRPQPRKNVESPRSLRKEVRVKERVGPHVCTICNQGFGLARNLSNHMFVHQQHETFHCETCGQNFSHRRYLTLHGRVHDPTSKLDKNHECTICRRKFTYATVLNRHIMSVHSELDRAVVSDNFGVEVETSG